MSSETPFPFRDYTLSEIVANLAGAQSVLDGYEHGERGGSLSPAARAELIRLARGFRDRWQAILEEA